MRLTFEEDLDVKAHRLCIPYHHVCLKTLSMINGTLKYCDYHNIKMLL